MSRPRAVLYCYVCDYEPATELHCHIPFCKSCMKRWCPPEVIILPPPKVEPAAAPDLPFTLVWK